MPRVVVLNASFEVLGVVPLKKALRDVFRDRVEVISESGEFMRANNATVPVPAVVIHRKYIHIPYDHAMAVARWSRGGVLRRDEYTCMYCGRRAHTIDHVLPTSRGGENTWENTVASCLSCNNKKDDRTPEEAGMKLSRTPFPVRKYDLILASVKEAGIDLDELFVSP